MHEAKTVIRQDPQRPHAVGATPERCRDLARRRVGVPLRSQPISDSCAGEAVSARGLVMAYRAVACEVLGMPLRGGRHAIVAADRGDRDRYTKLVVDAEHLIG